MRAERLERLTTIYTTPGFTDERIHLFLAHGLSGGPAGGRRTSSWSSTSCAGARCWR